MEKKRALKKLLCVFCVGICTLLCAGMMPMTAKASRIALAGEASECLLYFVAENEGHHDCTKVMSGKGFTWDETGSMPTLTLKGYNGGGIMITATKSFVLKIEGKNIIRESDYDGISIGFDSDSTSESLVYLRGEVDSELNIYGGEAIGFGLKITNGTAICESGIYNLFCNQTSDTSGEGIGGTICYRGERSSGELILKRDFVLNAEWNVCSDSKVYGLCGINRITKDVADSSGGKLRMTITNSGSGGVMLTDNSIDYVGNDISQNALLYPDTCMDISMPDANHLYCNPRTVLTFDANGGSARVVSLETDEEGYLWQDLPEVVRAGYRFGGWKTDDYRTIDTSKRFYQDLNLYADWLKYTEISEVELKGLEAPANGETPSVCTYTESDDYQVSQRWFELETPGDVSGAKVLTGNFEAGKAYVFVADFNIVNEKCCFTEESIVYINNWAVRRELLSEQKVRAYWFFDTLPVEETIKSGIIGADAGVKWELNTITGILKLEGEGYVPKMQREEYPWYADREKIKMVEIGEGLFNVPNDAFNSGYTELSDIIFPSTLTEIGEYAFFGCPKLENLTIPASVQKIGLLAFSYCGIKKLTIKPGLTELGESAFMLCKNMKTLVLSDTVQWIQEATFYGVSLTKINYMGSKEAWEKVKIDGSNGNLKDVTPSFHTHSFGSGWETDETNHWRKCSGCDKVEMEAHNLKTTATVKATLTEDGKSETKCTVCGMVKKKSTVYAPKTFLLSADHFNNDGKEHMPTVTVKDSRDRTISKSYYTVSYVDMTGAAVTPVKAGTYQAKVVFKGLYTGTKYLEFVIEGKTTYLETPMITKLENASTGVKATWGAVEGAQMYRLMYKVPGGSFKTGGYTTNTSYTVKGLTSGEEYFFTVRCMTSDKQAITSDYDRVGVSITYIAAPILTKVSNASNGVKVEWEASAGAELYKVMYKEPGGSYKTGGYTKETNYTVTGLTTGVEYTFTARCMLSNKSAYTSSYNSTGLSIVYKPVAAKLDTPKITKLENTASGVKVTWGAVEGAEMYRVMFKEPGGTFKTGGYTTSTSYTVKNLVGGTEYAFTVRCMTADKKTNTSDYDRVGTTTTYITQPVLKKVYSTASGVKVSWELSAGAELYKVMYRTADGTWKTGGYSGTSSYTVKGLTEGTEYFFTVRCMTADKKSYTSSYDKTGLSIVYVKP